MRKKRLMELKPLKVMNRHIADDMELMNLVYAVELGEKSVHGKKL